MKKKVSVVGAVIFNEKNGVLCALRSPTMSLPNYWEFPGGKINEGEMPQGALVREIKEKLGCLITVGEKIEEVDHEYENIIVHLVTYKANIKSGIPKVLGHADIKWVQSERLLELNWASADIPKVKVLYLKLKNSGFK